MKAERNGIAPALVVSAVIHIGALLAVIFLGGLFKKPLQLGGGVPVTLVSSGPPEAMQAPKAEETQEAQAEDPVPEALPEPTPPPPAPAPAPTPTPTPKPTPVKPTPTPTPTPVKKPTPRKDLDLDKLLSDVQSTSKGKPSPAPKPAGRKGPARDAAAVQVGSGRRVSAATQGYLHNLYGDLSRRWIPNCLVEGGADAGSVIKFRVSTGGRLLGKPVSSEEGTKEPLVRVASERAKRAVYAAEPFVDFPPELYGEELIYPFDAATACANR